ncbi:MAG: (Fe-S)-binding protein [Candidatus Bipolaricaulia bacterium]
MTGALPLDPCYHCGRCSAVCPAGSAGSFRPRRLLLLAQLEPERLLSPTGPGPDSDLLWWCTTCDACVEVCPQAVKPPEVVALLRSRLVEAGHLPEAVNEALRSIYRRQNPWGLPKGERAAWAAALPLKRFAPGMEWLWFVGCSSAYDPRNQAAARALVKIFAHAGLELEVGFLGEEERCCGEPARRLGEEGLFQFLAEENAAQFEKLGARKILTTCPHAYHAFKSEYPSLKGEVYHYTQLLAELIHERRLAFTDPAEELIVTYHDPCYLGRHSGLYEEPRFVLRGLPGVKLVEMAHNRERSRCCGGGGGRMWVSLREKEHPSELRVEEALETGARALITACPFCACHLDEAVKILNAEAEIEVLDLAELVARRLSPGPRL